MQKKRLQVALPSAVPHLHTLSIQGSGGTCVQWEAWQTELHSDLTLYMHNVCEQMMENGKNRHRSSRLQKPSSTHLQEEDERNKYLSMGALFSKECCVCVFKQGVTF